MRCGATRLLQRATTRTLELMSDERDYFQRQAENHVRLSRPIRVVLAILVVLGAAFFVLVGALLVGTDRSNMPSPKGALLLAVFMILLGLAFGYIGARLLSLKQHGEHLLTARGARIASYCVAVIGALVLFGSILLDHLDLAPGGLFAFLMAYWLHTSAKRIGQKAA